MFDVEIYKSLIFYTKNILFNHSAPKTYNEIDVVNDLYIEESFYDLIEAKKRIKGIVLGASCSELKRLDRTYKHYQVCKNCKELLPPASFRIRIEKRTNDFSYSYNICYECEKKKAKEYHKKKGNDETYREKAKQRVKEYYYKHKNKICKDRRGTRSTEAYKQYVNSYYLAHREKIRAQAKAAYKKRKRATMLLKAA